MIRLPRKPTARPGPRSTTRSAPSTRPAGALDLAIGGGWRSPQFGVNDPDRYDADRYAAWVDHTQDQATFPVNDARLRPTVPTVGTGFNNAGQPASQALFGDHGHSTPLAAPEVGMPNVGKLMLYDRSDIGLTGGNQQTAPARRCAGPDEDAGAARRSAAPPSKRERRAAPSSRMPTSRTAVADNMYPHILGRRISVVRDGTNDDFTQGSVGISPVTQPAGGAKTLVPTVVNVSADIPTFQPDDLYATRWRASNGGVSPPNTAVNPFTTPYQDLPENLSVQVTPAQQDDRLRRITIFVNSNHNGRLDLDPAHREAYRTFVLQVGVKPDLRLDTREQLLDFGSMWHGRYGPMNFDSNARNDLLEWQTLQQMPANSPQRAFYLSQWRFFTPENTGNVNLAYLKPEARISLAGSPPLPAGLPGEAIDPFRAFTFLFNPAEADPAPGHINIRTSFDALLNHTRAGAATPYLLGDGGWLQKAAVGAPGRQRRFSATIHPWPTRCCSIRR